MNDNISKLKTTAELDALKVNWMADPCWDIEDTEGFEAHYTELHDWRVEVEQEQERQRNDILRLKIAELNCSKQTAEHVMSLERRLAALEAANEKLQAQYDRLKALVNGEYGDQGDDHA